ncbi:ZZ-type zinc finger-containing protein 3 [Aethina tumida]|uniref:ZZ-type zinc finger-containing protein 3 n=1 Tax=Aethina tumida TaxID=116153 RepID=UPI00096B1CBD|nr:ZZ-type zinc finger-containing protein 3 [Aethina tumida]
MNDSFGLHTEDDLFYFESDHLAIRGNKDYSEVLKTVVLLTVQREQAIKDYRTVCQIKKEALEDPLALLEKIKQKEDLGIPLILDVPKIPKVDFQNFSVKFPESELNLIYSDNNCEVQESESVNSKKSNQWTVEEQKRLEELLVIYPPEPIEAQRFKKIAKALGTRTVKQVNSRVQKYFLKLYKAGLPIPGRLPKNCEKYKKALPHKHQRNNHYFLKPTTFFPELSVPVTLNEEDNIPGPSSRQATTSSSSNYLIPSTYHQPTNQPVNEKSEAEMKLELLKRVKEEKMKEKEYSPFFHTGHTCDFCNETPIVGSRWHCVTCSMDSVDFCTDCMISQMYSDNPHPISHNFYIYTDDTESQPDSDNELNSGTCVSETGSEVYYKNLSNDSKPSEFDKTSDMELEASDMELDDDTTNLSYKYLHTSLMFHEND